MGAAFELASFVIANLPGWVDAGMKVADLFTKTQAVIAENTGPGNDDWNALDAQAKQLQDIVRDTSRD